MFTFPPNKQQKWNKTKQQQQQQKKLCVQNKVKSTVKGLYDIKILKANPHKNIKCTQQHSSKAGYVYACVWCVSKAEMIAMVVMLKIKSFFYPLYFLYYLVLIYHLTKNT